MVVNLMSEKKLNLNIVDGDEFFAQEASVSYNPTLFNLDFRRITSRIDMRSNDSNVLVLRHNVVILEPYVAKKLVEIMQKSIERYEQEFGAIVIPEQIKQLEKKVQSELEKKTASNVVEFTTPTYFG